MASKSLAMVLSCLVTVACVDSACSASADEPPRRLSARSTQSPLPPGGAATIKHAQGSDWSGPLIGAVVTGGIFLAVLLLVNDDADGPATTSTTATLP